MLDQEIKHLAAIDVGSNSIHLVVARVIGSEVRTIDCLANKVGLGAGFDEDRCLTTQAQDRALEYLRHLQQRISGLLECDVRAVATNALRIANNSTQFCQRAEEIIGRPLEIISGREEARLIYLGVAHTLADDEEQRLVIDIGGGSTEFILGRRFEPICLESLYMGSLSYRQWFFPQGEISSAAFEKAERSARLELMSIDSSYKQLGWQSAIGASGTVRCVVQVAKELGLIDDALTRDAMVEIKRQVLNYRHTTALDLPGLKAERKAIFPAGLAILLAIFDALGIEELRYSSGALREGVLYDLIGRNSHEDVRDRSIRALMANYKVDQNHAEAVQATALKIYRLVAQDWAITDRTYEELLSWSALVHEIGLAISHSGYHKHGAYILRYSDLNGFSQSEQKSLAFLVRAQRRKFVVDEAKLEVDIKIERQLFYLAIILRLAVLLHRSRDENEIPLLKAQVKTAGICLGFAEAWLETRVLTQANLEAEEKYLLAAGCALEYQ